MTKSTYIVALLIAFAFSAPIASAFASATQNHQRQPQKPTVYRGDPLGRAHWTAGRNARMRKQLAQAQYHEQQEERANRAQQKVAREKRRKHINRADGGGL